MGKGRLMMTKSTAINKFLLFYYIKKIIYINKIVQALKLIHEEPQNSPVRVNAKVDQQKLTYHTNKTKTKKYITLNGKMRRLR